MVLGGEDLGLLLKIEVVSIITVNKRVFLKEKSLTNSS